MNKTIKNSILVIGIIIVLLGIIWFVYDMVKTEPADSNSVDMNLADENTGLDNIINELFDNVQTNELVENKIDNTNTSKDLNDNENDNSNNTINSETVTSKEDKAIELVKQEWGGTEGVYFRNESIDEQGRYIVSVRDRSTTNSLAFFVVDVNTGLVTKQ